MNNLSKQDLKSRLGIAYAGSKEEYELDEELTLLERKINNGLKNKLSIMQVRTNDLLEYVRKKGMDKLQEYLLEANNKGLEISVHLPSPVPDKNNICDFSEYTKSIKGSMKSICMAGVKKYTIHPHYNRIDYSQLNDTMRQEMLRNMAKSFADIVSSTSGNGREIVLAIENVPVRNLEEIINSDRNDSKIQKARKNVSFGMYIPEIRQIIDMTRNCLKEKGEKFDPNYQIGMTFDTGHAANLIEGEFADEEKYKVWGEWLNTFKDDIRLFHISPNKDVNGVKNKNLISYIYGMMCDKKMNADAFVENHFSFKDNDVLAQVCRQVQQEYEMDRINKPYSQTTREEFTKESEPVTGREELEYLKKRKQVLQEEKQKISETEKLIEQKENQVPNLDE